MKKLILVLASLGLGCAYLPLPSPPLEDYQPDTFVGKSAVEVEHTLGHPDTLDTCQIPVNDPKAIKISRAVGAAWYYEVKTKTLGYMRSLCVMDDVVVSERVQFYMEYNGHTVDKEYQFTDNALVNQLVEKHRNEDDIIIKPPARQPGEAPPNRFPGQQSAPL